MITIRALAKSDCVAIARLHLQALRTPFAGRAGEKLLAMYYASVASEKGAVGYVAENVDSKIIGFVCGVWQAGLLRKYILKRYSFALAIWGSVQVVQKPQFLASLTNRLQLISLTENESKAGYELRPIVVAESARGMGIAKVLVQTLLQDARQRGFGEVYLYTEPDNLAARNFYGKVGFTEVGCEKRSGLPFIHYLYEV